MDIISLKFDGNTELFSKELKSKLGIVVRKVNYCGGNYYKFRYVIHDGKERNRLQMEKIGCISAFVGDNVSVDNKTKLQIR